MQHSNVKYNLPDVWGIAGIRILKNETWQTAPTLSLCAGIQQYL